MFRYSAISSVVISLTLSAATGCLAQNYEAPLVASAQELLGPLATNPNFMIEDRVPSDGFVRFYTIVTPTSRFLVAGREMLDARIGEINVLAKLQALNESNVFTDAVAKSALAPVNFAGQLIVNPVNTVGQALSGVGTAFARVAAAGENPDANRDKTADSLLGVSSAKRQLAAQFGVDPYTDYKPLADKLDEVARVMATGNLTVSAALMAVPGVTGLAVSSTRNADTLKDLVSDKTPPELRQINRSKLAAMGVPSNVAEAFLKNPQYTPTDQTIIVASLGELTGVQNRALYIQRASNAAGRDLVFFLRGRAEQYAIYHRREEPLREFIDASGVPLAVTRSGRVIAIFPLDGLAWTKTTSDAVTAIDRVLRGRNLSDKVEIRIGGSTTPRVRQELLERHWKLVENAGY